MKKNYARLVDVPKVEKNAYNHGRFISSLVMHQLIHLSAAEQSLPEEDRTHINISTLHTERDAAGYVQRVTAKLHQRAGKTGKKAKKRAATTRSPKKNSRSSGKQQAKRRRK